MQFIGEAVPKSNLHKINTQMYIKAEMKRPRS